MLLLLKKVIGEGGIMVSWLMKIIAWRYTYAVCIGIMTDVLIRHIGLSGGIEFGVATFLLVQAILYRINKTTITK